MRPQHVLRATPAVGLAVALSTATMLAAGAPAPAPTSFTIAQAAAAPVAGPAASDTQGAPVQATVEDRSLGYGRPVVVAGRLASGPAGAPVALQYRPAGAPSWRTLRTGATTAGGRFRLAAALRRSGVVRVVGGAPAVAQAAQAGVPALAASPQWPVRVRAAITTRRVRHQLRVGRPWRVAGTVRTRGAGRVVRLQLRRGGRWRTVDRDRTSAAGRFVLHERPRRAMSSPARIRFAGDGANAPAERRLGRVNAYRTALASWYGPGLYGNRLGCGGTLTPATIGVAHKALPCGARLTLRYRGHVVRARVVDRGPYVGGRELDLTAATKRRLHFPSTGLVQVTR